MSKPDKEQDMRRIYRAARQLFGGLRAAIELGKEQDKAAARLDIRYTITPNTDILTKHDEALAALCERRYAVSVEQLRAGAPTELMMAYRCAMLTAYGYRQDDKKRIFIAAGYDERGLDLVTRQPARRQEESEGEKAL